MKLAQATYADKQCLFLIEDQSGLAYAADEAISMEDVLDNFNGSRGSAQTLPPRNLFDLAKPVPIDELKWLPPVSRPEKIICVGRNYEDHAREMKSNIGDVPVIFSKLSSALTGNKQPIELPSISDSVDYEAELVVVVGRTGKNITQTDALDFVFGYTCGNDITARDWQAGKPGGQWLLGKSCDTFAPIGPWIVTADELTNAGELRIQLRLNGRTMQDSNTSNLIFEISFLISHLSRFMTLQPGDLIFTGTPPGVGAAKQPPAFLKKGDLLAVEIESIGILENRVSTNC